MKVADTLWDCFVCDILDDYHKKFEDKELFNMAGIEIAGDRIKFDKSEILFEDLDLKTYSHYSMIFSRKNPHHNKMLYCLKGQDAVILLNILNTIIKKNEPLRTKEVSHRKV